MNCEVLLQIFAGGFLEKPSPYDAVKQKLNYVLDRMPVHKVIIGWSSAAVDSAKMLYEETAAFLYKRNIDFYLWFPVFSETGVIRELGALADFRGKMSECKSDEDFSFCCPNNPQNIDKILDIFESEFASVDFTGVFLDRIRYPSFANNYGENFKSAFTCFCPHCLSVYEKHNLDVKKLKESLSCSAALPFGITEYRGNGEYVFEDTLISDFFSVKTDIIYESLKRICSFLREKKYNIGFDVFAPFLSPFLGQNLEKLSGLCDFIKPMMYRATNAPAGLPFELEALLKETGCIDDTKKHEFYKILGYDPDKKFFDLFFAARELKSLAASSACPVYGGVEINRVKDIADVYPDYIEETLQAYSQTGIKGFALSWNLLDAPEENIAKAAEVINKLNG